uniref:CHAT domain-containing protein n=1 Tax=Pseudictyota dubia TaxID=2749911 RepID=A0A7R9WG95_9STRA|mmetsp:Transcript_4674/g.8115  ORF Transcript_4674/g.8115 Transcript_4674/m.8115 type:complete len:978 (+) Transcript_4674:723-3656(+)
MNTSWWRSRFDRLQQPQRERRYDILTVFQAWPLVLVDEKLEPHNIANVLNFDCEISQSHDRKIITKSLSHAAKVGAEIDAIFETGTTDRLSELLACGGQDGACRALHFSCHGGCEGLYFEDGLQGKAHAVMAHNLQNLITAGGVKIQFVFVFACHSRKVGEAFLNAGVSHVVCCCQDKPLMDQTATVFCRDFYAALACDRTLREAFESGRQAVKTSAVVENSEEEMNKLLLLPEDGTNHDIPVFFANVSPPQARQDFRSPWSCLPQPPHKFIGRGVEMHRVLCELQMVHLVRLIGPTGAGKRSLAAALCHFINARKKSYDVDKVIWLPFSFQVGEDELASSLRILSQTLHATNTVDHAPSGDYKKARDEVVAALREAKGVIIAIDSRGLNGERLANFLSNLLGWTENTRVILVCGDRAESVPRIGVAESTFNVGTLSFLHSSLLFGGLCRHISGCPDASTPMELAEILVPVDEQAYTEGDPFSARSENVFQVIGGGVPAKAIFAANMIEEDDFKDLVKACKLEHFTLKNEEKLRNEEKLSKLAAKLQAAFKASCETVVAGPVAPADDEEKKSEEDYLMVGVDLSGVYMHMDQEWAQRVAKNKDIIDVHVKILLEETKNFLANGEAPRREMVEVKYTENEKTESAVVTLRLDIELSGDLDVRGRCRIQRCCESIANALRRAGVPENLLQDIKLYKLWQGSVHLLMSAPTGVFGKLWSLVLEADMNFALGDNAYLVSVVPAFLIKAASTSAGFRLLPFHFLEQLGSGQLKEKKDALQIKRDNVLFLVVPTSPTTSSKLPDGGISLLEEKSDEEWSSLLSMCGRRGEPGAARPVEMQDESNEEVGGGLLATAARMEGEGGGGGEGHRWYQHGGLGEEGTHPQGSPLTLQQDIVQVVISHERGRVVDSGIEEAEASERQSRAPFVRWLVLPPGVMFMGGLVGIILGSGSVITLIVISAAGGISVATGVAMVFWRWRRGGQQ